MALSETAQLWLTAVLSGLFAGLVAILVTVAIERTGGLLGGVLGTLPTTIVPASIGLALQVASSEDLQTAMATVPVGMLIDGVYLLQWRYLPPMLPAAWAPSTKLLATTAGSTLLWLALAGGVLAAEDAVRSAGGHSAVQAMGVAAMVGTGVLGVLGGWRLPPSPPGNKKVSVGVMALRGVFAGVAILAAVLLGRASSALAGLVSVFPAIFFTTMVALWLSQGAAVGIGAVSPMVLGSGSVSLFATVFAFAQPAVGTAAAVAIAWPVAALGWSLPSVLYLRWRRGAAPAAPGLPQGPQHSTVGRGSDGDGVQLLAVSTAAAVAAGAAADSSGEDGDEGFPTVQALQQGTV